VKILIDECLHTSLVSVAHSAGHTADYVAHRGLGGLKDWQLMQVIREQEYTFVTNNRSDFLDLHGKEPLHAGVIVIVPNVIPSQQRELFAAALKHIGTRDLTNTVVEVRFVKGDIQCSEYELPRSESR
jgi:predicted nuclease of predicted toxin-antitoxin system